jgi:hypothetical protein
MVYDEPECEVVKMFSLLKDEIEKAQENSLKYEIDGIDVSLANNYIFDKAAENEAELHSYYVEYWVSFLNSPNYYQNFDILIKKSKSGDKYASAALAALYFYVFTVKDYDTGMQYLDMAIQQGCGYAAYMFAVHILIDPNAAELKNRNLDVYYMEKAAELNCNAAIEHLEEYKNNKQAESVNEFRISNLRMSSTQYTYENFEDNYDMMYLGNEFCDAVDIPGLTYLSVNQFTGILSKAAKKYSIPASFTAVNLTKGGLGNYLKAKIAFNDTSRAGLIYDKQIFRAIRVSHPNPPQQYSNQLWVFNGNTIKFFFAGGSDNFKEKNEVEMIRNGETEGLSLKGKLMAFTGILPADKNENFNKEMEWHEKVLGMFMSML